MALSRIVIDDDIRAIVDQIQSKTRSNSPSAAIALMVSRYGRHLLETWELTAARYPEPCLAECNTSTSAPVASAPKDFKFTEPIEL